MNPILNTIITLIETFEPAFAPFLESVKADIAAGKNVTAAQIKDTLDNAITGVESLLVKYKNALEQTKLLLDQSEATIVAWQTDIAAAGK